ncbi:MAG: hypothetical protein B6I30_03365 [Desulfobacteraceae bacterium 4572_187]|nr:MAG: hypothetical protein B6I30_03365 [Desulfobacteraceae bacterium 4572_187]
MLLLPGSLPGKGYCIKAFGFLIKIAIGRPRLVVEWLSRKMITIIFRCYTFRTPNIRFSSK